MKMQKFGSLFSLLVESGVSLLYPPLCLHCGQFLPQKHKIFCADCFLELEPFSIHEKRCFNCFNPIDGGHASCKKCQGAIFSSMLAVFPLMGAAATLHAKLRTLNGSYLCQAAAALMALQLLKADWPLPDLIISLPQSISEKIFQSYSFNAILALELANILQRPYKNPFRWNARKFDFSRIASHDIKNKSLLLISDVLTGQGKMHEYAEILADGYPKNIYGIALCQAI